MNRMFLLVAFLSAVALIAQNNEPSNAVAPVQGVSVIQTNNLQPNTALPPAPPSVPQASAVEKPAVIITAQGTVLNDEQKRLISQKLQEIPGVVVITNRIHVVGQINEAAGAATTNHGKSRRSGNYRSPR